MKNLFFAVLHSVGCTQKKLAHIRPGEEEEWYHAMNFDQLISAGYSPESATKILEKKSDTLIEKIGKILSEKNIHIVHRDDNTYPSLLKNTPDAPTILYVRGQLPDHERLLSIVGSRKHSNYAVSALEKIIPPLIQSGYTIVSGGAYGIDTVSHTITVKNSGYTLVVLGSGVDVYYPQANTKLFNEIIQKGGAIISHFPLGTSAEPYNFPMRNALVAGISQGTIIAEAGEESGTLITARLALEANRDVFVIPADISRENARGSNALIRDGLGKLILGAEDILFEYGFSGSQTSIMLVRPTFTDPLHEKTYDLILQDINTIDAIVEVLEEEVSLVMNVLTHLEIEGIIQNSGGIFRAN